MVGSSNFSDSDLDFDSEYGCYDEEGKDVLLDVKENELFTQIEFLSTIGIGRIIAIYSCQTENDPFFLCKVLEKTRANTSMAGSNDHYFSQLLTTWYAISQKKHLEIIGKVTFGTS